MFHRGDSLRAVVSLFRVKGGFRPSRARLAQDLRAADGDLELLEQLWALSFSREIDPAHDSQRAPRIASARLWQWSQCARLALCRGPCESAGARVHKRRNRAFVQYRREVRAKQSPSR